MEYLISNSDKHIMITNEADVFFEKYNGDIYVYGAGLCGYWIGYYLAQCRMDYKGYIDRSWQSGSYQYNGKDMHKIDVLKYDGQKRIIVSPHDYSSVISDILLSEGKINCICLLPVYYKPHSSRPTYDINQLLGYFRKKLLKGEVPTILSNDCTAGVVYRYFNLLPLSPTINTSIAPSDFIKLCMNPEKYLKKEVEEFFLERLYLNALPNELGVGFRIDDISVHASRLEKETQATKRWNSAISHINWKRLIYIYNENQYVLSYDEMQEFKKIKGNKLLILNKSQWVSGYDGCMIRVSKSPFFEPEIPIERSFDVLGWMNRCQ